MSTHTETLTSTLAPGAVLDGFEVLAADRGWKLKERRDDAAKARQGVNFRSWSEQIEISADPVGDTGETKVQLVVHTRQMFDWGEGETVIQTIRERLSGSA